MARRCRRGLGRGGGWAMGRVGRMVDGATAAAAHPVSAAECDGHGGGGRGCWQLRNVATAAAAGATCVWIDRSRVWSPRPIRRRIITRVHVRRSPLTSHPRPPHRGGRDGGGEAGSCPWAGRGLTGPTGAWACPERRPEQQHHALDDGGGHRGCRSRMAPRAAGPRIRRRLAAALPTRWMHQARAMALEAAVVD